MTKFRAYRYQLLPIDRHTEDLFEGRTLTQLVEQKNSIFASSVEFVKAHRHRGSNLAVRLQSASDNAFILEVATSRPLVRETSDFRREEVEHWPHVTVIVLNDPSEQYILVQDRPTAFSSPDTVVKIIHGATRYALERAGLTMRVESLFNESDFWGFVRAHRNKITWVEFEFVTPNMANISNTLTDTLKTLAKDTNATQSNLQLRSDPKSSLDLEDADAVVRGLVDYSSQGGGNISLKARGVRKRINTADSAREIELDDLQLSGPPDQVVQIVRGLLR